MSILSADTDPRIEKIQIEMLRQVSPARKMRIVAQMNYTLRTFMMAGLKQRNPEAIPETLRRMLAALLLGDELARKVSNITLNDIRVTLLVADALEKLGIKYVIGGSLASALHGVARATMDTDIVADLHDEH